MLESAPARKLTGLSGLTATARASRPASRLVRARLAAAIISARNCADVEFGLGDRHSDYLNTLEVPRSNSQFLGQA